MPKLYYGNSSNNPVRLKKVWFGNSSNNPVKIKKIWVGDSSNNPKLIFMEGASDGYTFDYDASAQGSTGAKTSIINSVNSAPHQLQDKLLPYPGDKSWMVSSLEGRPISFNNNNGALICGRGGTFRLSNPVNDVTLLVVQRLDIDKISTKANFTNSCFFNEQGSYGYTEDNYFYTGRTIGEFLFRGNESNGFKIGPLASQDNLTFINRKICAYWMYTSGNNVYYEVKSIDGETWSKSVTKQNSIPVQDVRVCDHAGGGVDSLTGELYEFIIWPRALSKQERTETEEFIFDKWK